MTAVLDITRPSSLTRVARRTAPSLSADARGWLFATVALVLSCNVMFSRYLFWDSYYDLYVGRYIAAHGIPRHNTATVAAHGARWIDQQWLAHLAYYFAWRVGGYVALAAVSAILVTAGFALLMLTMLRRHVPPVRAFRWTVAAFVVCMGQTVIRAQSFGFLFFGALLWLLVDDASSARLRRRTLLVLPLLVAWANVHGTVLMAIGLVGVHIAYRVVVSARDRRRDAVARYLALGVTVPLTAFCTPYGLGILHYYTSLIGNTTVSRNIVEWRPPSLHDPVSWGFFTLAVVVAFALCAAWRRGTRPDLLLLLLAATLLSLAFTGVRYQPWFAFAGALLAAETLSRSTSQRVPVSAGRMRNAFVVATTLAATGSLVVLAMTSRSHFERTTPRRAIDAAARLASRDASTTILGDDSSGTAALWLEPSTFGRIGFDARLEQYSDRDLAAYFDFLQVRGSHWQRILRGYGIVVASRQENPKLADALAQLSGWRVAHSDPEGIVIVRSPPT